VLRSAIVAFALPLVAALLGAWLLSPVGEGSDGWPALGALTGLVAGHLAGRGWTVGIDAPRLMEDAGADATVRP
jgi:positive regulator of sigma E activity